jgi:putative inorganic carbon (HCO3(-)) transporter
LAGRIIARAEPLYLVAIAPLLLFPMFRPALTVAALAGLALLWLTRALLRRETWPVTPFNAALLVFCLAIPLAVWASPIPELTIPKLTGVILGLAAFRVVAYAIATRRDLMVALAVLAAIGVAIWALGVLGLRLAPLQPLTQRLPAALVSLPGAEQGINPNQLAGALMLLLPLLLGCAAGCWQSGRRVLAGALLVAALPALLTLVLTRSRAGWIGLAAATLALLLAFVWLKSGPRRRKALIVAVALAFSIALTLALVALPRFLASAEAGATIATPDDAALTLEARAEIWSRALYALQDFPFTGVGLGAFRRVVNVLYPLFLVPPDADIAHSHNMFLQVGVDLGLIGLVGYGALLLIAGVTTWQVASHADGFERYIALGALGALVGLHVYGLADALALGSKPSVVFWIVLGLAAALPRMRQAGSKLALLP